MTKNQKILAISFLGGMVNFLLSVLKISVGFWNSSQALIAEGVHSLSDIVVSVVTYLGVKKAQKPADESHPYGHQKYENIASLIIAIILIFTGVFLIYEAFKGVLLGKSQVIFSWIGILLMFFSILVNEVTARLKLYAGKKYSSLALIADGQHDRMDVIISVAVLFGLFFVKLYPLADSILSIMVGVYIAYESYNMAIVSIDTLVDAGNPELKKRLEIFLKKEKIDFTEIKIRKFGYKNLVEMNLKLNSSFTIQEASGVIKEIENKIKDKFPEISQTIIQITSHNIKGAHSYSVSWIKGYRFQEIINKKIKKEGGNIMNHLKKNKNIWRCVVPLGGKEINYKNFGAKFFLVLDYDKKNGQLVRKEKMKNPFWEKGRGHGIQFVRWVEPDKVVGGHIGSKAIGNLKNMGVLFSKLKPGIKLQEVIKNKCGNKIYKINQDFNGK